jgi:hypothetical protein
MESTIRLSLVAILCLSVGCQEESSRPVVELLQVDAAEGIRGEVRSDGDVVAFRTLRGSRAELGTSVDTDLDAEEEGTFLEVPGEDDVLAVLEDVAGRIQLSLDGGHFVLHDLEELDRDEGDEVDAAARLEVKLRALERFAVAGAALLDQDFGLGEEFGGDLTQLAELAAAVRDGDGSFLAGELAPYNARECYLRANRPTRPDKISVASKGSFQCPKKSYYTFRLCALTKPASSSDPYRRIGCRTMWPTSSRDSGSLTYQFNCGVHGKRYRAFTRVELVLNPFSTTEVAKSVTHTFTCGL